MGDLRSWCVVLLSAGIAGCVDDPPEFSCDDPKYDNGVCDLDTSCGAPDLDCFTRFDTPEAAAAWFDSRMVGRGPSLPTSDARFAPTQALIDEGWEAYKRLHTVGDLANFTPQLVLVQNDTVNAFVLSDSMGVTAPEQTRAGFAVMVHTALVDLNAPKEQVLGTIMHEFEHAGGLHVNPAVKDNIRKFYKTPADSELLGYQQADDPAVREFANNWSHYAAFVGFASDAELSGMPLMVNATDQDSLGAFGYMGVYFFKLVSARVATVNTTACTNAANTFGATTRAVLGTMSVIDNDITVDAAMTQTITTQATALRDNCFAGVTGDAIHYLALTIPADETKLRAAFPADMRTIIEMNTTNGGVITGWYNAINAGRKSMRDIEASFMTMQGVPWSRFRFFSTEEAADDSSARTMVTLKLAADGAGMLLTKSNAKLDTACTPLLAGTAQIPYGQILPDEHHATCWRVRHQRAIGADNSARVIDWKPITPDMIRPGLPDAPLLME